MKKGIILLAVLIAATAAMAGCGGNSNSSTQTTTAAATVATTTSGELTEAEAKAAALKDANIPEAEATFVKAVKKTEDGYTYYEIEFTTSNKKYTYKIVATNGTVKDKKVESYSGDAAGNTTSGSKITEAEAKTAALQLAELSEGDVTGLKASLTTKNGVSVYKVVFKVDDEEQEYLINASTGELYEAETENDSNEGDSDSGDTDTDSDDSDDSDYSDEDNGDTDDSDGDTDSNDSDENNNENNNE